MITFTILEETPARVTFAVGSSRRSYFVDRERLAAATPESDALLVAIREHLASKEQHRAQQARAHRAEYLAQGFWVVVYPSTPGASPSQGWQGNDRESAKTHVSAVLRRRPDLRGQDVQIWRSSNWYDMLNRPTAGGAS